MYKLTNFDASALVEISLLCEENIDKKMFTRWELCSSEIDLGDVECEFENKPSKEDIDRYVTQKFKEYVERVIGDYGVQQMTMDVYDDKETMMNDEGLNWEDVLDLRWGEIIYLSVDVDEYEVEEEKLIYRVCYTCGKEITSKEAYVCVLCCKYYCKECADADTEYDVLMCSNCSVN